MTLLEAIRKAAVNDKPLTLSSGDASAVLAALEWGQRILDGLNDRGDETEGGNSYTSGLEEEHEGVAAVEHVSFTDVAIEDVDSDPSAHLMGVAVNLPFFVRYFRRGR